MFYLCYMKVKEFQFAVFNITGGLIWLFIEKLSGLHDRYIHLHPLYTNLGLLVPVVIYFLAFRSLKKEQGNKMTFRKGIEYGSFITVVSAPIASLIVWLFLTYISPDFFKNAIEFATFKLGKMQKEAEAYFNMTSYIGQVFLGTFFIGGILTVLYTWLFTRKNNSIPQ